MSGDDAIALLEALRDDLRGQLRRIAGRATAVVELLDRLHDFERRTGHRASIDDLRREAAAAGETARAELAALLERVA